MPIPEIHVGDIGTVYEVELLDAGQPFAGAEDATVTELIFGMPNGLSIVKEAILTTDGSPASRFFLTYAVQPNDGIGSPGEFHDNAGPITIQAHVARFGSPGPEWEFSSTVATADVDGNELRIHPNITSV